MAASPNGTGTVVVTAVNQDKYPHLERAPLVEAVIDWRTKLAPDFELSKLKDARKLLPSEYQIINEERGFEYIFKQQITGGRSEHISKDLGVQGYRFSSKDNLEIVRFKEEGFSFSRLKPYTSWDDVFSKADRLWKIYRSIAKPEEITRIAVRYINRIPLPVPVGDFTKFLTKPPVVPEGVPQRLRSMLYRVVIQEQESQIATNITQVIEAQTEGGTIPFILDIDAYIVKRMEPDVDSFASHFAPLREMKNRVFFATLTDTAISMFK